MDTGDSAKKSDRQLQDETPTLQASVPILQRANPSAEPPTLFAPPSTPTVGDLFSMRQQEFGEYQLLAEIGRGGMGVVYRAKQRGLERIVALKMIRPGGTPSEAELERFRVEARETAQLQHPHIVTLYEVGEISGCHFYTMDFIDGPSLAQKLTQGPLPTREAARYVLLTARAIHYAHQNNLLHRDLKPSNILLDSFNEPHVTDFGLAKKLGADDSGRTRTGAILGTPSYMAPEQAAGKIKELSPACDIYGLGAVLYELLTGRPPFCSDTPLDTLMQVIEREPAPPRLLNPKVDRDLETICLKCLEKDPENRYATAEQLANDLERYLKGETISIRSINVFDRLQRTLERGHHIHEFRNWGNTLLLLAAVIFAEHLYIFFLTRGEPPYPITQMLFARFAQLGLMAGIIFRHRGWNLLPTSAAERQLWSIWTGYLLSAALIMGVARSLATPEKPFDPLLYFPYLTVLSGMGFFTMGSNYWGRCYLYGIACFGLAIWMAKYLKWGPLVFGLAWSLCLLDLGIHLRRLAREGEEKQKA